MTDHMKIVMTRWNAPFSPELMLGSPPASRSWAANTSALLKKIITKYEAT